MWSWTCRLARTVSCFTTSNSKFISRRRRGSRMTSEAENSRTTSRRLHLVFNARIWEPAACADDQLTWMTFDVNTGYIDAIGGGRSPPPDVPEVVNRTDCGGRRILPGLHDAHLHVAMTGCLQKTVDLQGCTSIDELQSRLRHFVTQSGTAGFGSAKWIVGRGWEQDLLGRYPNRHDLDAVASDRPIYLKRVCGHIAVVNSLALQLVGFNKETVDPPGGRIERSQGDSLPTGLLFENALDIVNPHVEPTFDEVTEHVELAVQLMARNGVTSATACEENTWPAFCRLADENRLPIRIFYSAYFNRFQPETMPVAGQKHGSLLSCDRVKLFADGALGVSTAAMSQPYNEHGGGRCNHGMLLQPQEELTELVHEATALGYRVEIHVIGDRAAEVALNALESVNVSPDKRPVLIHCQILREDLIDRMQKRGVIASIQPQFVPTDCRWLSSKLPPELLTHAYVWKTLLRKGVRCAGGSDSPVEKPEPLVGLYDTIFRRINRQSHLLEDNQFKPEECLTVQEAVELYTVGGAYAAMQENRLGRLLPGYQADFIVLDKDVCSEPETLLTATVEQAWVGGQRKV